LPFIPGKPSRFDYRFLPPALFFKIVTRVLELRRAGKAVTSSQTALRDDQQQSVIKGEP
jgi:hypothetical protein